MKFGKFRLKTSVAIWLLLIFSAFITLLGTKTVSIIDNSRLERAIESTGAFMEKRIKTYENIEYTDITKNLFSIADKTEELSSILTNIDESQYNQFLTEYAFKQHFDGVFVLDENLNVIYRTNESVPYEVFKSAIEDEDVRNIMDYSFKIYSTRITEKNGRYDLSVVSRRDKRGLIAAYDDLENVVHENDFSADSILNDFVFELDGVCVLSDGSEIITSNNEKLDKEIFNNYNSLMGNKHYTDKIITIMADGEKWLGNVRKIGDYYLYMFFPESSVYLTRNIVIPIVVIVCLMCCMLLFLLKYISESSNIYQLKKQLDTIKAISSIYEVCINVSVKENNWEIVKTTEPLEMLFDKGISAKEMISVINEVIVANSSKQSFTDFLCFDDMDLRINNEEYLSKTFELNNNKWFNIIIVPFSYKKEKLERILVFARNVTEEKLKELEYQKNMRAAVELAERANIAKTDFLRRMSHDIRTPINGIMGMLNISEHYIGDEERQADCRNKIGLAAGYLLELVNNVLDMNKLESGRVKLEEKQFDFIQIMNGVKSIAEIQAREQGIKFITKPCNIQHSRLIGSTVHLKQILQNIAGNAIKYNKAGGKVEVCANEILYDGEKAVIEFICADTGIGMSKDFQKYAYDVFAQENESARTIYGGTGLGLAISRELVVLMGGTIEFESEVGKGTTFNIKIPFKVNNAPIEEEISENSADKPSIAGANILVAEDNDINMEIARFILENEGAVVTEAHNGVEAVNMFKNSAVGEYDVILLDVMMPVMDGTEAAKLIRAMDREDALTVPMFAMTANAFSDDVELSMRAGMNEHISKPIDKDKLVELIAKYYKKRIIEKR